MRWGVAVRVRCTFPDVDLQTTSPPPPQTSSSMALTRFAPSFLLVSFCFYRVFLSLAGFDRGGPTPPQGLQTDYRVLPSFFFVWSSFLVVLIGLHRVLPSSLLHQWITEFYLVFMEVFFDYLEMYRVFVVFSIGSLLH